MGPKVTNADLQKERQNIQFELQQQRQEIRQEEQQQTVVEDLFQQPEVLSNQEIADRRMTEMVTNGIKLDTTRASATATGAGNPLELPAAKEKGWKERRRDKKRAKKAKKLTPTGNEYTERIYDKMSEGKQRALNSFDEEENRRMQKLGIDTRVIGSYVQGHKVDAKGNPLNEEEAAKKSADKKFIDDYASKDVERRAPYLMKFTNDLINEKITMSMLTDDYLIQHADEVKNLGDRLMYFENIYKDPINKPFFDKLSDEQKDLVEKRILNMINKFPPVLQNICQRLGINFGFLVYYNKEEAPTAKENSDMTRELYFANLVDAIKLREGIE